MNSDEIFTGDCAVIAGLLVLEQAQKDGNHEAFSGLLRQMWRHVYGGLPEEKKLCLPAVLLKLYMENAGDVRKGLDQYDEVMATVMGYDRHQAVISALRAYAQEHQERLLKVLQGK